MTGKRTLQNFKYRQAVLNIEMNGYGNQIKSFNIDGKPANVFSVSSNLTGSHDIKIELADNEIKNNSINKISNYTTLQTPELSFKKNTLNWKKNDAAKEYKLIDNGKLIEITSKNNHTVKENGYHEFSVIAIDSNKVESFAAEPLSVDMKTNPQIYEIETYNLPASYSYNGFSGKGFVETSTNVNRTVTIPVEINETGLYAIDIRYANGNGPINTENKCAIRTLKVDTQKVGTLVFPQRGKNDWNNWGFSNSVQLQLNKGKHILSISFEDFNDNMNGEVNAAMLDFLRITYFGK
jgi:hypothetical protein